MGQRHERSYVDLHLRFFLPQRMGQEWPGQPKTGIVHEQVDGEAPAHDLRVQIQGPVGLGKIGGDNNDVNVVRPQQLRCPGLQLGCIAGRQNDRATSLSQRLCHSGTDARRGSGNQSCRIRIVKRVVHMVFSFVELG